MEPNEIRNEIYRAFNEDQDDNLHFSVIESGLFGGYVIETGLNLKGYKAISEAEVIHFRSELPNITSIVRSEMKHELITEMKKWIKENE